jgi:uncharacterized membrane protein
MATMLMALALVMAAIGCEQTTGPENQQGSEQTYRLALSETGTYAFHEADFGYNAQTAKTVTVTNIGKEATGKLTLAVAGDNAEAFKLSKSAISNIAVGKTTTFTVKPNTGLSAGVYTATVTVSGSNGIGASFDVSFTVNNADGTPPPDEPLEEPVYGISLDVSDTAFPEALEGYPAQTAKTVTVTNIGKEATGSLKVALSGDNAEAFKLSKSAISNIAVDKTATFTVKPNTGLAAGVYTATVTVSGDNGISESFEVSFTVNNADGTPPPDEPLEEPVYGISLDVSDTAFSDEVEGYGAQEPITVTIRNTGNRPTGALMLKVSSTDFSVSRDTVGSIAVGGTETFFVRVNLRLAAGTHTAKVSVSGEGASASNIEEQSFDVSFEVTPVPEYGIDLSETGPLTFEDAILGYGDITPQAITVTNTGNQPTGALSVALTGDNASAFALNPPSTVPSIAVGTNDSFTIVPNTGLDVGTYTALVTVSGGSNIEERSFEVSFTVTASYGITLSQTETLTFPEAVFGYPALTPQAITITNSGDQPTGALTVALTGDNASAFALNPPSTVPSIAVGTTGSFTIVPNTGLAVGSYAATVSVSGGSNIEEQSFSVSFVVTPTADSFASLVPRLNNDKALASVSYTLPSGAETYTASLSLTTANSPANVVIDGGGRAITGSANSITVGAGITLTLKDIKFTTLPLTVTTGGKLILGSEGDAANSAVVQGNTGTGVTVNGGTLELKDGALVTDNHDSGIVLDDSQFTMTGGEISDNEVKDEGGYGGGVLMKGANSVFTMGGGVIRANKVPFASYPYGYGGGVAIVDGGKFMMTDGAISDNKAARGGGVYMGGEGATFTMTGGSISDNETNSDGGGVYMAGDGFSFTLDGGDITENKAGYGAGVMIIGEGGTFSMTDGSISDNIASNVTYVTPSGGGTNHADTGGVSIAGANNKVYMSGGEISGNTSEMYNGGIRIGNTSVFNMTGGVITNNRAVLDGGGVRLGSTTTFTGDPRIGNPVTSGSGQGWIYGNTPDDVYYVE